MFSLSHFNAQEFLQEYWQKKPLLIKGALSSTDFPLSPDELAGMACEEEIESRLIVGNAEQGYELSNGPFKESLFSKLPEKNWTLLVQAVDHYIPEVAALLNYFRFIPNWRIDDVMVSYAAEGGSAGPHYDNYDVFLIQGLGSRRWQLGPRYDANSKLQKHEQLKLLADFSSEQEWLLEPGDILYLPPLLGHWGISASDDCMTYSVGFRAPSVAELLADFCDDRLAQLTDDSRYTDTFLETSANPGEIGSDVITRIQELLSQQLSDGEQLSRWFGRYMTRTKYAAADNDCDNNIELSDNHHPSDIQTLLSDESQIVRDPASRFAFSGEGENTQLFVNGQAYNCAGQMADLAQRLCACDHYDASTLREFLNDNDCAMLLTRLFDQGSLYGDNEL